MAINIAGAPLSTIMKICDLLLMIFTGLLTGLPLYAQEPGRQRIPLSGEWQLRLNGSFDDRIQLPGTLAGNGKGTDTGGASGDHLYAIPYTGPARFRREINIPASWRNRQLTLFLERTKATRVWINDRLAGSSTLLSAPQVYDLTGLLAPGKHLLTIEVDNSPKLAPVGGSHAMSEHTQTNWNGIIGNMYLEAADPLQIRDVRISTDVKRRVAYVQLALRNTGAPVSGANIILEAAGWNAPRRHRAGPLQFPLTLAGRDTLLRLSLPLGSKAQLWSEYTPALYRLRVTLQHAGRVRDSRELSFGLREFKPRGTQFTINEVVTFLRGKNDGCIFPLTGYPPTDTAAWRRLYRIAKSYGINHYRFHSYTPPEAAFAAADAEGIYIQAELPNWSDFSPKDTSRAGFQYREGMAICDAYGNHPSFVMLSLGNELGGDSTVHNRLVAGLRTYDDNRRLYARGTNAFYAAPAPGPADDYWVTMRTGPETPGRAFDVRGSFATTEDSSNGIINTLPPDTRRNFSAALKGVQLPVIGHETGQYQVYPDYREIPQYKGVLQPRNLALFRQRLQDAGMGDQANAFMQASGKLAALLYREEIEMALRTPGMAGFQLLDLQDYPGQGTALVGLLNAFMGSKGLIAPAAFRQFNNDRVVQLLMDKYVWTNAETFTGAVQVVNYSPHNLNAPVIWTVYNSPGKQPLFRGSLPVNAAKGGITAAGNITFPTEQLSAPTKLTIQLQVEGTGCVAAYPLWVYPAAPDTTPGSVKIATALDAAAIAELNRGGKVLLFPDHAQVKDKSVPPQFISEFWNWKVFKNGAEKAGRPVSAGTLGILTDPSHPLFARFPTELHTNWQWWHIVKHTRPLVLDKTPAGYRPIVQVIDNIDRNHKLGMICEFSAGRGRLLVCMANLRAIAGRPEARQLYSSLLRYMESDSFRPQQALSIAELQALL